MLSGCPFVLPFIPVEQNVPPTIIDSSPGEGEILVVENAEAKAFVIVTDPDDLDLTFVWEITREGIQPDAITSRSEDYLFSQLTVEQDPDYDQKTLSVTVYDPSGSFAERSWTIDIPEGVQ